MFEEVFADTKDNTFNGKSFKWNGNNTHSFYVTELPCEKEKSLSLILFSKISYLMGFMAKILFSSHWYTYLVIKFKQNDEKKIQI